ncbi:unnamed protein product [Lymnaea stagnalis]|uniref:Beta-1,4-galactosyltransferase n=1 Tax=Lymnaea stagnalis TaxID=6523 RepID=A0AAV2HLY8_LYMST
MILALRLLGNTAKYVVPICLLALAFNYVVYNRLSTSFGLAVKSMSMLSTKVDSSNNSHLGPEDVTKLVDDTEQTEILKSIRNILLNLTVDVEVKPMAIEVLKQLVPGLRNQADVESLVRAINRIVGNTRGGTPPPTARPPCPVKPKHLIGAMAANLTKTKPDVLEKLFPDLEPGGHHEPGECRPSERLAIVVPYRNRFDHLHVLLHNLIPVLVRQQLDFTIFVIEQDLPTTFNRGMLFNVGFLEALKSADFDCFIFHDVDMIPLNDRCLYRCAGHPRHLTAGVSKWKYGLPYPEYFGGVVAFTRHQFEAINGDSNLYFGWGGEDDDLQRRVAAHGFKTLRFPAEICRYEMIKHGSDVGNTPNPKRMKLVSTSVERMLKDGLNTTTYEVTKYDKKHLYTWINVFINRTEVLQGAVTVK